MRRVFPAHFLIGFALSTFAAFAQGTGATSSLTSDEVAAIKAHMSQLVSQTSGAQGVFEIRGNGGIQHMQSGGSCPGYVYGYTIRSIVVTPPSPGRDVAASCIYDGGASGSELTLTYSKAEPGETLDSIFERAKAEELSVHPDAKITDAPMKLLASNHNPDWADMRSAVADFPSGKAKAHVQLIVGETAGWTIDLRAATYPVVQAEEERGSVGRLLFQSAPDSLFLLELSAIHNHAAGSKRPSELSSGKPPSQ
jgi:hypothetical protein